jgi:hypothetical protein
LSLPTAYRAPSRDGQALILPSTGSADGLLRENRKRQSDWRLRFSGRELQSLRSTARHELVRDAIRYTSKYRVLANPAAIDPAATIIMSGHQPTLFHPGVWFKNFAIDAIAKRLNRFGANDDRHLSAVAINLVIDNDVATSSSVRVPTIDPETNHIGRQSIAFDSAAGGVPYEQNRIRDRAIFDQFACRVKSTVGSLVSNPLIDRLWPYAVKAAGRCENVSCALAQARHALEGDIGLQTLELPLSVVCRSESFAAFAMTIIADAVRFRSVYNAAADTYRSANRIRSSAHPVPNLGNDGEWTEVPFWIYSDNFPQRRAAWSRVIGDRLEISDRGEHSIAMTLPIKAESPSELVAKSGSHFKLRPRALATTMYARLFLCDLFIHGIGGAKYDELGDSITRKYFGIETPELMVVSATVLLPIDQSIANARFDGRAPTMPKTVSATRLEIRRTHFAPETFADRFDLSPRLCQAKKDLIDNPPGPAEKKHWHDQITALNVELSNELECYRQSLVNRLPAVRQSEAVASLLGSREHSFCLFPLEHLTSTFESLLDAQR